MANRARGFTLVESIGAVAVTAALAVSASPLITGGFDSVKVEQTLDTFHALESAVARFHADTGQWPVQRYPREASWEGQLRRNTAPDGGTIAGWNGPYIDADLINHLASDGSALIAEQWRSHEICDLDGDGNTDGASVVYRLGDVSEALARKVSDAVDSDGSVSDGVGAWYAAGRVRLIEQAAGHGHLIMCMNTP
ncbi:MAG: hypothetical protein AAF610_00840 [Pseudomonadota bacterium]